MEDIFWLVHENKINRLNDILNKNIINVRNVIKQSLLHEAVVTQNLDIAKILISKKINVNNQDYNGQTALHYMPLYKNIEIAKLILENGGDVNQQDSWGNTPLWAAIIYSKGHYDLVNLYLEYGAKINIINHSNKTCYDLVAILNDLGDCNSKELLTILEKNKYLNMEIFFNDIIKHQYLENLNFSEQQCLEEFDKLSKENGSLFGIKDDNNRVLKLYCENENLFLVAISIPSTVVNYLKRANKDECKKIITEIYRNNRIIVVDGMVKFPIKKNFGRRIKKS